MTGVIHQTVDQLTGWRPLVLLQVRPRQPQVHNVSIQVRLKFRRRTCCGKARHSVPRWSKSLSCILTRLLSELSRQMVLVRHNPHKLQLEFQLHAFGAGSHAHMSKL